MPAILVLRNNFTDRLTPHVANCSHAFRIVTSDFPHTAGKSRPGLLDLDDFLNKLKRDWKDVA